MKYSMEEFFKAMKIEENPNAGIDFVYLIILLCLFILISIAVKNYGKIKMFFIDKNLYNFIIEFKDINPEERRILERIIEKNKIKKRYEILIIEGIFDKYIEREIVNIKMGFNNEEEKIKNLMKYNVLREKLFGSTDTDEERIEWE